MGAGEDAYSRQPEAADPADRPRLRLTSSARRTRSASPSTVTIPNSSACAAPARSGRRR